MKRLFRLGCFPSKWVYIDVFSWIIFPSVKLTWKELFNFFEVLNTYHFTLFKFHYWIMLRFLGSKKFLIFYTVSFRNFISQKSRVRSAHWKTFAFATASVVVVGREVFFVFCCSFCKIISFTLFYITHIYNYIFDNLRE